MEIIDSGTYVNEVQALVCMSFEARTSVHMSFEAQACIKTTPLHIATRMLTVDRLPRVCSRFYC